MSNSDFDPIEYWKKRHVRYAGDVRSVGNVGKSVSENDQGSALIQDRLRKLIGCLFTTTKDLEVLDLACGIGRFAPMMIEFGFQYTGVDISEIGLQHARRSCPKGHFIETEVTCLKPERTYDLVLSLYFLVHVIDDIRWNAALDVICQSIGSKGFCILMDDLPEVRQCPAVHVVQRSRREYEKALATRGLEIEDTESNNTYLISAVGGRSLGYHAG